MKLRIVLLLIIVYCGTSAQELLMPVVSENDSLISDTSRNYMSNNLFPAELFLYNQIVPVQLPDFNFDLELTGRRDFFIAYFAYNQSITGNFFPFSPGLAFIPFVRSESVFSSANYKISDRFSLGGFSYGGSTIFSAPLPNRGTDNYDFRSSTLFMEYNVSKNFKIGTRVSVTRSPGF